MAHQLFKVIESMIVLRCRFGIFLASAVTVSVIAFTAIPLPADSTNLDEEPIITEPLPTAPVDDGQQPATVTWPCWRGVAGDNHSTAVNPPLRWSQEEGICWKVAVPGRGHASPCVWGDQIFLASAEEASGSQLLISFDTQTGEVRWQVELHRGTLGAIHANNSHASATPACDGKYVYVPMVSDDHLWISAIDLQGQLVWQTKLGDYAHANGFCASPAIFEENVIVASDNQADPAIVAIDRHQGCIAWRTQRAASDSSGTPVIGHVANRPQLLLNGAHSVSSYDPQTGKEIWTVPHKTEVVACSMAFDNTNVYASGRVPEQNLLCVRADGHGNVAESHVQWQTSKSVTYVPSPLLINGCLFLVIDSGVAFCREASTGDVIWDQRLGGDFFSSPVFAAGMIYATNEAGTTFVFRADKEFELVAENSLGETTMATPVICKDRCYLRTSKNLYAIESL